uniref:DH domain-containing protein n=2 Tax=Arion vulgaris TaxID=1028688 RepID=A0A0B7BCF0_9EUPU
MDKTNENCEYPTDYIDIVNEINDFIASLDASPLDNHTKELVGNSDRCKFGQHGSDFSSSVDWNGTRSRHTSGDQNVNNHLSLAKQQVDCVTDGGTRDEHGICAPVFPFVEDAEPVCGVYGSKDLDVSKSTDFGDYSDCGSYGGAYSDVSSNCGGDVADSDSGCYSHYQQPRSDAHGIYDSTRRDSISSTGPTTHSPSFPNIISGKDRVQASLSSPKNQQLHHQHLRPQSPDRLSAEYLCEPDSIDKRFHQIGSSAHTLATTSSKPLGWDPNDHDYQEPSNIPRIPESPVPKRRPPIQYNKFGENHLQHTSSPNPLSTSLHPINSPPNFSDPDREIEGSYSLIKKQIPQSPSHISPQKLNIKTRWPPAGSSNESPSRSLSPVTPSGSQASRNIEKSDSKEKQQESITGHLQKQNETSNTNPLPLKIPITRVPDLSVLISELRSANPRSEPSPTSSYTSTARSENVSPKPHSQSPTLQPEHGNQQLYQQSPTYQSKFEYSKPKQTRHGADISVNQSTGHRSRLDSGKSPSHKIEPRTFSPSQRQPVNGITCRNESPEHDYEPIENIQLEVPATPRPQTKFPHPQGPAMAETGEKQPKHVKASHNFKGANNDELCFKKGDIITVTQCVDGGWWEGTLNGRTGWFPLNYTKEVKTDISYKNNKTGDVPVYKRESMQLYHNVVLKNVIETEKTHVSEMLRVLQSYIKPLEATNLLTAAEYTLLVGNSEEIIAFQQSFLAALEECEKLPSVQRRVGGIFMQFAPRVKELYSDYCANHPKAVSVLQKKREELGKFVENLGAPTPGAQTLTTILSKPFTRLDKYPSLLKELERHVEESHPDRGDTQRAIAVYRNIANSCLEIRKLKEMEYEIVTSTIQGWEGEEIAKLGEVIHLSQVKMITQTGDKYERIFVLFSSCLVMLSMSTRLSSYHYEGKIPLNGLIASPCENTESFQNSLEISGPMIEKITVLCGTRMEVTAWLEILNQQLSQSGNPSSSTKPQPLQVHMTTTCQTSVSTVTSAKTAQISSNPPAAPPPQFPLSRKTSNVWSMSCLRPSPPLRPTLMCREEVLKSPRAGRKSTHKRKPDDAKVYNEDAFILQVIEAYCNSIKTRHTVNSCRIEEAKKKPNDGKAILTSPQILLAEEEKIFDETELQERTVVDTVYALQDRVKELEQEQRKLRQDLEEEKRCRKKLESLVRQQVVKSAAVDGVPDGNS